ncbi:alpha/beta hydrolase family protein [Eleftheria terrae]|uniref:alpha/beta hydrolase family protein n=1 Tax=Eleftheria terrae TaxID=1597781 RepID=UPI00263B6023|nr:prolyl oligopeptidase family serine peptidase [Eleftheria terrae]WKB55873.1 prolyl oligopeptidase family serine peptidase [Eleftheria terrae]
MAHKGLLAVAGVGLGVALGGAAFMWGMQREQAAQALASACVGSPLRSVEARNQALEDGHVINPRYDCVDKPAFEAEQRRQADRLASAPAAPPPSPPARSLLEARQGFRTQVSEPGSGALPLPHPPAQWFIRTDYVSTGGLVLPAFITPDPKDGRRHPAILWLTGGETHSLGDFWVAGPPSNDQSASAFREAGIVVMFPTLRGGHQNPGRKEYFLGEVDDVLAAAQHLARQPHVDPNRIYLGGHSTGGTLALLAAEMGAKFEAVFAFGPVAQVDRYPPPLVPAGLRQRGGEEVRLRSPLHWLHGIASPTYLIEGRREPGNLNELAALCQEASHQPLLFCVPVEGEDHFSVLSRVGRVLAARIAVPVPGQPFSLRAEEFAAGR